MSDQSPITCQALDFHPGMAEVSVEINFSNMPPALNFIEKRQELICPSEYKNGEYGWGNALGRVPSPDKEIFSLYDYRRRIAQYRTDKDLLLSHQKFPWIPVWDDHGKKFLKIQTNNVNMKSRDW